MAVMMPTGRQAALPSDRKGQTLSAAVFKVEREGKVAIFSELGAISSEVEAAEYMEAGTRGPQFGRFLGKAKPPTVTLKRSMTTGPDSDWVWAWHQLARTGSNKMTNQITTLSLIGAESEKPLKTYMLINAIPTKVEIAGIKAGGTEVVQQTLTMMCDEIIEG